MKTKKVRFFNPGLTYQKNYRQFLEAIKRVLKNGDLILRQDVEDFEKKLAEYVGTKYAVALNSGTDALYLSLVALNVRPGQEVLVPSHTFVATAQVVQQLGAIPVLYDMDNLITPNSNTAAIIVAHLEGEFMCDMNYPLEVGRLFNIPVIEDACQALGAMQGEKMAGSFGDTGCFSFYPAKILGCFGDGGALVTNREDIYEEAKELRNHYKKDYSKWGINSRLDNIQAAVLNIRLGEIGYIQSRRKEIAELYDRKLRSVSSVILPPQKVGRVWQDYVIKVPNREALKTYLTEQGVETMYNDYPFPIQKLPQSLEYESTTLRIPCNENLTDKEVEYVISKIKEFYADINNRG